VYWGPSRKTGSDARHSARAQYTTYAVGQSTRSQRTQENVQSRSACSAASSLLSNMPHNPHCSCMPTLARTQHRACGTFPNLEPNPPLPHHTLLPLTEVHARQCDVNTEWRPARCRLGMGLHMHRDRVYLGRSNQEGFRKGPGAGTCMVWPPAQDWVGRYAQPHCDLTSAVQQQLAN
jgi:hypothetical protein